MPTAPNKSRRVSTPEWRAWKRAIIKLQTIKAKTLAEPSMHGEKWERKMEHHYDKKISELRAREPQKFEA